MTTSVLRVSAMGRPVPAWTPVATFEPTATLTRNLQRAVSYVIRPPLLLSEDQDRSFEREALSLASPLADQMRSFASPVVHGGQLVAMGASHLVRQEALRLTVEFAREGLDTTQDRDEVVMPSVHQAHSGAIQFEWHRKGVDLEITVLPSGGIVGYVEREGVASREVDLASGMQAITQELRTVLHR
jgi:hypothetical protein